MTAATPSPATGAAAPHESFAVPTEVAWAYERTFVPDLFAPWARLLADAVAPAAGERVLDVACGTGIVARTLAERCPQAEVQGLDLNPAMLEVARAVRPDLGWRQGDAADLPFDDAGLDLVTCQAALMFLPDPAAALREMARVTAPGGRVGLLVVGRLGSCAAYVRLAQIVDRHAPGAGDLVRGYFGLGEPARLDALLREAALRPTSWDTAMTDFRRASIEDWVSTEVEASPLRQRLDDVTYARIRADVRAELTGYEHPDGGVAVPLEAHVVVAQPVR